MTLSEECSTAGHFEVAYHALAAAAHMAKDDNDSAALTLAHAASETQAAMIDALSPPHAISTSSARNRGTQPLHVSLKHTIEQMQTQLRLQQQVAEARGDTQPPEVPS